MNGEGGGTEIALLSQKNLSIQGQGRRGFKGVPSGRAPSPVDSATQVNFRVSVFGSQ